MCTIMNRVWFLTFWLCISLAASRQGFGPGEQEWGYVTVRENAHMFWWLYYVNPPDQPKDFDVFSKPLLIWLQGGPGVSSTGFGNFEEIGPLDVNLNLRNYSWVNYYNILFIDQPIGTGFSYTNSSVKYPNSKVFISQNILDIFNCIKKILTKVKKFEKVPTYILGESYGGRVVVKLAQLWHQKQDLGMIKSNLKGIALGNAWISPIDSIRSWAPYLLAMGIIDTTGFTTIEYQVQNIILAIYQKRWTLAKRLMDNTLSLTDSITDGINKYNILAEESQYKCVENVDFYDIEGLDNKTCSTNQLRRIINFNVTSALGIARRNWNIFCRDIYDLYVQNFLKSVTHIVEYLLNQTDLKIVVYHGQLDMIIPIHSTLTWLENLQWKYSAEWFDRLRSSFKVNGVVQGYVKSCRNLKMYWIIRSGHMVPKDNPSAILAILQAMTEAN